MSRLVGNNKNKQVGALTEKSMTLLSGISLPIVVGGIILASPIISVAYGQEFIGSVPTFQILLLTLLPVFPGMILSNVIFAENKQKVFIKSTLLGACTNIALDFILIPIYGIAGSAIATFIAQIVMNGILYIEVKKTHNIKILNHLKKIIIGTIVMSLLVVILKSYMIPLLLIIPISAICFFGLLLIQKEKLITEIKDAFLIKPLDIQK